MGPREEIYSVNIRKNFGLKGDIKSERRHKDVVGLSTVKKTKYYTLGKSLECTEERKTTLSDRNLY